MWSILAGALRAPLDDYLAALDRAASGRNRRFLWVLPLSAAASWWIYVPIHELLHAYGCLWSGGEVTRLEIDAIYGAAILQRFFPFVAVGSDYAGQLTGFDTRGSDWIYLATDLLPFSLTVLIGVPLLRAAAKMTPGRAAAALGAAVPIAFAPILSLPGDYYEMGSILATRAAVWISPSVLPGRWRSDDFLKLCGELYAAGIDRLDLCLVAAGMAFAVVLALTTYAAGSWLSRVVYRV